MLKSKLEESEINKSKSLAILIPTRNRSTYLNELLSSMMPQTVGSNITVYVRDNKSTDNTEKIVEDYQEKYFNLKYHKNEINVGGDVNFLLMVHDCREDYFWIFGDDELLMDDGLKKIMNKLTEDPDYLIMETRDGVFNNFSDYVSEKFSINPFDLIACTLITSNIVKKSIFDLDFATTKYSTHYGHMYGIVKPITNTSAKIITIVNDIFIDRGDDRASPVDGDWSSCLEVEWGNYLKFIAITNKLKYPWFKILVINLRRKIRYRFGKIITLVISVKLKKNIKKMMKK